MTAPLRLSVELSAEQIEQIAKRAAEMAAQVAPAVNQSPYLSVAEAAAFLRTRRQRIDDLLSEGLLTHIKDGNRTLIARDELAAYLRGETRPPRAQPRDGLVADDAVVRRTDFTRSGKPGLATSTPT
jgi:excisionase family DNA binding protein